MSRQQGLGDIKEGGLGGHVTKGMAWMLLSTFMAKGGSFAAQIVLGWLLLKEDFGVYAIANRAYGDADGDAGWEGGVDDE